MMLEILFGISLGCVVSSVISAVYIIKDYRKRRLDYDAAWKCLREARQK